MIGNVILSDWSSLITDINLYNGAVNQIQTTGINMRNNYTFYGILGTQYSGIGIVSNSSLNINTSTNPTGIFTVNPIDADGVYTN